MVVRSAFVESSTTETEFEPVLVINTRPVGDEKPSGPEANEGHAPAKESAKRARKNLRRSGTAGLKIEKDLVALGVQSMMENVRRVSTGSRGEMNVNCSNTSLLYWRHRLPCGWDWLKSHVDQCR